MTEEQKEPSTEAAIIMVGLVLFGSGVLIGLLPFDGPGKVIASAGVALVALVVRFTTGSGVLAAACFIILAAVVVFFATLATGGSLR